MGAFWAWGGRGGGARDGQASRLATSLAGPQAAIVQTELGRFSVFETSLDTSGWAWFLPESL